MELEQLRMFVSAAESGSFSAAGRELYTSHSTVSRAVSALEKELGVTLISRSNRVLGLTAAGELLLEEARELLKRAEELREKLRTLEEPEARFQSGRNIL